jgi:hypothetical protein
MSVSPSSSQSGSRTAAPGGAATRPNTSLGSPGERSGGSGRRRTDKDTVRARRASGSGDVGGDGLAGARGSGRSDAGRAAGASNVVRRRTRSGDVFIGSRVFCGEGAGVGSSARRRGHDGPEEESDSSDEDEDEDEEMDSIELIVA